MSLAVIGAGFGRTGTLSISVALERLGYGPCYHMDNVFANAEHLARWQAVADGDPTDWERIFAGYAATVDWPGMLYYRELADAFPDAKVLLSVRPADSWWKSFSHTVKRLIESRDTTHDQHIQSVLAYAHRIIAVQTFGDAMDDKDAVIARYENHIDDVTRHIAAERLLVYQVTEGWGPLCEFLGVPEPREDFPRKNNLEEFWQHFGAGIA